MLVGTCLIIIIPEGIETLYGAGANGTHTGTSSDQSSEARHSEDHKEPHAWVGLMLAIGFIMMYLIDQLPRHASKNSTPKQPLHISLANLSQGPHRASSPSRAENAGSQDDGTDTASNARNSATTIGLVIHAAADGIALAASTFLSQASTGFIVFIALMIHKAPAAFGLTSVLLKQGLTKRQARAHLLIFSLAAPVGALATFVLVIVLAGGVIQSEETTHFITGLLLIFSGGTFLYVRHRVLQSTMLTSDSYVAMHTMQEAGGHEHADASRIYANGHAHVDEAQSGLRDTLLSVVGMLLPLMAQVGHAH